MTKPKNVYLFERPVSGENAVLVCVFFQKTKHNYDLPEFRELVRSADIAELACLRCTRDRPDAKFLIGAGKVEELATCINQVSADLAIFNFPLTPSQIRNLETTLKCRVIDRTQLILDIFAQRARSYEGKLQVELAQLRFLSTRLVRGWSHLERQRGVKGLRSGPGEKQLELDRRSLQQRIKQIDKRLEKVQKQRQQNRSSRKKSMVPTVALVGYTNTGKSTLFNVLTKANSYAENKLFATLDPTTRKLYIDRHTHLLLTDTVGFIRDLPHDLVAAFRATLEETRQADLLLHIVDASDEHREQHIEAVNDVLRQIHAQDIPQILIFNKIDRINTLPNLQVDATGRITKIWLSALTGKGIDLLLTALNQHATQNMVHTWLHLTSTQHAELRKNLFRWNAVLGEECLADNRGWNIEVYMPRKLFDQVMQLERSILPEVAPAAKIQG